MVNTTGRRFSFRYAASTSLFSEGLSPESLRACINFYSNPTSFEAPYSVRITLKKMSDSEIVA